MAGLNLYDIELSSEKVRLSLKFSLLFKLYSTRSISPMVSFDGDFALS